jgi:hypothetical protein
MDATVTSPHPEFRKIAKYPPREKLATIISGILLLAVIVRIVTLVFPSVAVPTLRTETITVSGVLVVFPGYTSLSTADNSTRFYKVPMTNTVMVTSEVIHTDFKTMPMYTAFGLSDTQFMLLAILIVTLGLPGVVLLRRAVGFEPS